MKQFQGYMCILQYYHICLAIILTLNSLVSVHSMPARNVRNAFYLVPAENTRVAMDIRGDKSDNGMMLWASEMKGPMKNLPRATTLNGARNQLWIYEADTKIIKSTMNLNKVIDISGNKDGNLIHSWDRHGRENQQWDIIPVTGDLIAIKCAHRDNRNNEKYITFKGDNQQFMPSPPMAALRITIGRACKR